MVIVGIGTEIVECARIGRMIESHGELFLQRVYTAGEIRHCLARKGVTERFAACWAAKEAVLKCLGGRWTRGTRWTELEVCDPVGGPVSVVLHGAARDRAAQLRVTDVHLSLAHSRAYATAYALAVGRAPGKRPPD